MPKQTITITTDAEGYFKVADEIQNPVWGITVNLKAALVSPPDLKLVGTFALGDHAARDFTIATGQTADLGAWKVVHGANTVSATGVAEPAVPNVAITVQFSY